MPSIDDKIARCTTYLEPELYVIVQQVSVESADKSVASWLRRLIIVELMQKEKLDRELVIRLLAK